MLGKIEGRRRRGQQRITWLGSITDSTDMSLSKLQEMVKDGGAWRAAVHGVAKPQTEQQRETTRILGMQDELNIKFLHREAKGRKMSEVTPDNDTVSSLHTNEFCSNSVFVNPIVLKSNKPG